MLEVHLCHLKYIIAISQEYADQRDHSERPVGLRGQLCRYQHPHGVHPAAAAQGRGRPRQPAAAGHGAGHGLPLERGCVR